MSNKLRIGEVEVGGRVWIAPMTGVSDLPFRRIASRLGAAYVATEMVASAEFARAIGLEVDASGALGGVRSKRYAMVIENGVVTHLEVEPGGFGLTCSLSASLLERL